MPPRRGLTTIDERWASEIERSILESCHPWQFAAITDPSRFFAWLAGRGGGKTTSFKGKYVIGMARIPRSKFIYVAPTLGSAIELLWEPFKELIGALGFYDDCTWQEAPREGGKICIFDRTGARLKLTGAEDKKDLEKYRGQPFNGVGVDECGSWPPELLEWFIDRIITPRLGERDGWLGLGGTPGHILQGPFYEATRPGSTNNRPLAKRDDPDYAEREWFFVDWNLADVVALPNASKWPAIAANWSAALKKKREKGWTDDNPVWMREYLGKWATDASELVYKYRAHLDVRDAAGKVVGQKAWNQWDPPRTGPLGMAELPKEYNDWNYGFGVDLGAKDPFATVVFAVSPSDPTRTLYHVWEVEKPKAYAQIIAQVMLGEAADHNRPGGLIGALGWPNGIVIDVANLGANFLDELQNVYGIRCIPSDRKPGQKFSAIELFNGSLIDGRVKILKGSKLEEQLGQLRWKEDEFRIVREDKSQANHLTDAAIYARQVLAQLLGVEHEKPSSAPAKPVAPQPSPDEPQPVRRGRGLGFERISPATYHDPFK